MNAESVAVREVSDLQQAMADLAAIRLVGSGSTVQTTSSATLLSTRPMNRILRMEPDDLTCSLQPGVPRFAKSAYIRYDQKGNVTGRGYAQSVIRSAKRFT